MKIKRLIAFLMTLALTFNMMFFQISISAASKVKVTGITLENCATGKLVLVKGRVYTLKSSIQPNNVPSKRLNYFIANKKVAKVSKKGKIKSLKIGKTTIIIQSKDNKKVRKK